MADGFVEASGAVHRNAIAISDAARDLGLTVEIREFPEGTRTAAEAAAAIGVEVGQIVKSLVFAVGDPGARDATGEVVVALVSGINQLDETKLAAAAGAGASWRVDADAARIATGYPVGGVPPLGHATVMRVFVDHDLLEWDEVWAAAGTPHHVFAMSPKALVAAAGAVPSDLAKRVKP